MKMQLTIKVNRQYGEFDILTIGLSKEIQHEIISLESERMMRRINDKQFKLKVLGLILRSEAE